MFWYHNKRDYCLQIRSGSYSLFNKKQLYLHDFDPGHFGMHFGKKFYVQYSESLKYGENIFIVLAVENLLKRIFREALILEVHQ